ncbi:hypothetical protein POP72_026 [Pectobacterium phage POP72]|uniref:Uncharacterized protein n=1 Tax=Pectobacterium phage POP72 TaxID=1965269 RepID=A0A2R2V0U5_9CAUD|nr:hypothetical protein POP72_026 [Pectobacterium phage POP72]
MPTIESRLRVTTDTQQCISTMNDITKVSIYLDGELYHVEYFEHDWHDHYDPSPYSVGCAAVGRFLKEWKTCPELTSLLEPKYRKIITSSCGQLTVTESL